MAYPLLFCRNSPFPGGQRKWRGIGGGTPYANKNGGGQNERLHGAGYLFIVAREPVVESSARWPARRSVCEQTIPHRERSSSTERSAGYLGLGDDSMRVWLELRASGCRFRRTTSSSHKVHQADKSEVNAGDDSSCEGVSCECGAEEETTASMSWSLASC